MKKLILILLFLIPISISAKETVTLNKCVDGDTAWFNLNGEKVKIRFLAIDTPESTNTIEPYGKEASAFTCNLLQNAQTITIEYDENSDQLDKYNRHLVWVFIDGELLQKTLVQKGYAKVAYLYGDYSYTSLLQAEEKVAQKKKVGIWSDEKKDYNQYWYFLGSIFILIFLYFLLPKSRNKIKRKVKSNIRKELKKRL